MSQTSGVGTCQHCGANVIHSGACPRIKAIEYFPDGTMKRVEYHDWLHTPLPYAPAAAGGTVTPPFPYQPLDCRGPGNIKSK